jgi:hypothetical protein
MLFLILFLQKPHPTHYIAALCPDDTYRGHFDPRSCDIDDHFEIPDLHHIHLPRSIIATGACLYDSTLIKD